MGGGVLGILLSYDPHRCLPVVTQHQGCVPRSLPRLVSHLHTVTSVVFFAHSSPRSPPPPSLSCFTKGEGRREGGEGEEGVWEGLDGHEEGNNVPLFPKAYSHQG